MRTPFYDRHIALGGKIVDFFGWELPVQYTTITQEHNAVRTNAGLFDLSAFAQRITLVSSGPGDAANRWVTMVRSETNDVGAGFFWLMCAAAPQ